MSRFLAVLKQTNDRLDLPQPAKSRTLPEITSGLGLVPASSDCDCNMATLFVLLGLSAKEITDECRQ